MIINHQYKFIYLKTRKTASTSLEITLSKFCGPQDIITQISKKDETIKQSKGYPGPQNEKINYKYYSLKDWIRWLFRLESKKFYNHMPASEVQQYIPREVWENYFIFTFVRNPYDKAISRYYWDLSRISETPEINEYLGSLPTDQLSDWKIYTIDDQIVADKIYRYEELENSLKELENTLGLPESLKLPHAKGGHRKPKTNHRDLLTSETIEYVNKQCKKEIKHFGHKP